MKHAHTLPTPETIEAYAASALDWLGWLMGVMLRLGAPRASRRLTRAVELLERAVESILFLKAVHRVGPPLAPRAPARPLAAAAGFRRRYFTRRRRLLFKRARLKLRRAGLYQRVLRAVAALARPEPYIARYAARLRRGLSATRITAVAPPPHACVSLAAPAIVAIDDS